MRLRLLTLVFVLSGCQPAFAQGIVFGGAFTQVAHDGPLSTTPSGVLVGAASSPGAGVELRWAADQTYKWLSVDFLQIAPTSHRGKSFQPFGVVGIGILNSGGDRVVGLSLGGGVVTFFTNHLGASLDYRYFRGRGTIGDVEPVARTISLGVVGRF